MAKTVEILKQARALIEDPKNWTMGEMCDVRGRKCALGAILTVVAGEDAARADEYDRLEEASDALRALDAAIPPHEYGIHGDNASDRIYRFNDRRSGPDHHSKVLALFDRAIAKAEANG